MIFIFELFKGIVTIGGAVLVTFPFWFFFGLIYYFVRNNRSQSKHVSKKQDVRIRYSDYFNNEGNLKSSKTDVSLDFPRFIHLVDIYFLCFWIMFFFWCGSYEFKGGSNTVGEGFFVLTVYFSLLPIFLVYSLIRLLKYSKYENANNYLYIIALVFSLSIFLMIYPKLIYVIFLILIIDMIFHGKINVVSFFGTILVILYILFGFLNPSWHLFDKKDFIYDTKKHSAKLLEKERIEKEKIKREKEEERERMHEETLKKEEDFNNKKIYGEKLVQNLAKNNDKFGYKISIVKNEGLSAVIKIRDGNIVTPEIIIADAVGDFQTIYAVDQSYSSVTELNFFNTYENSKDDRFLTDIFNKSIAISVKDYDVRFGDSSKIKSVKYNHVKGGVGDLIIEVRSSFNDYNEILNYIYKAHGLTSFIGSKVKVTFLDKNGKSETKLLEIFKDRIKIYD